MDDTTLKLLFMWIVGPILVAGGVYWRRRQDELRRRARTTTGEVVASDVRRANDGWVPVVQCHYTVDGIIYHTSQVHPPPGYTVGKRGWARNVAGRFRPGDTATVHYLPDDPATAYLIDKGDWLWLVPVALGGLLVALAVSRSGL
jgi:hypothetical protein